MNELILPSNEELLAESQILPSNKALMAEAAAMPVPEPPEQATGILSSAIGGVKRGVDQTQALLGGAAGLIGTGLGLEGLESWGQETYRENMREAQRYVPKEGAATFAESDSAADYANWAAGTLGELVPTMAVSMAGGGVGGLVGKAILGNTVKGLAAKGLAQKAIAGKIVGTEAKRALKKAALPAVAGQIAGAGVATTALESGGIYGTQVFGEDLTEQNEPDVGLALLYGIPAGMLDAIVPAKLLGKLGIGRGAGRAATDALGDRKKREALAGALRGAITTAPMEGLTEVGQGILERAAQMDYEGILDTPEGLDQVFDSEQALEEFMAGLLGGGVAGAGAGALQGRRQAAAKDARERTLMGELEDRKKLEAARERAEAEQAKAEAEKARYPLKGGTELAQQAQADQQRQTLVGELRILNGQLQDKQYKKERKGVKSLQKRIAAITQQLDTTEASPFTAKTAVERQRDIDYTISPTDEEALRFQRKQVKLNVDPVQAERERRTAFNLVEQDTAQSQGDIESRGSLMDRRQLEGTEARQETAQERALIRQRILEGDQPSNLPMDIPEMQALRGKLQSDRILGPAINTLAETRRLERELGTEAEPRTLMGERADAETILSDQAQPGTEAGVPVGTEMPAAGRTDLQRQQEVERAAGRARVRGEEARKKADAVRVTEEQAERLQEESRFAGMASIADVAPEKRTVEQAEARLSQGLGAGTVRRAKRDGFLKVLSAEEWAQKGDQYKKVNGLFLKRGNNGKPQILIRANSTEDVLSIALHEGGEHAGMGEPGKATGILGASYGAIQNQLTRMERAGDKRVLEASKQAEGSVQYWRSKQEGTPDPAKEQSIRQRERFAYFIQGAQLREGERATGALKRVLDSIRAWWRTTETGKAWAQRGTKELTDGMALALAKRAFKVEVVKAGMGPGPKGGVPGEMTSLAEPPSDGVLPSGDIMPSLTVGYSEGLQTLIEKVGGDMKAVSKRLETASAHPITKRVAHGRGVLHFVTQDELNEPLFHETVNGFYDPETKTFLTREEAHKIVRGELKVDPIPNQMAEELKKLESQALRRRQEVSAEPAVPGIEVEMASVAEPGPQWYSPTARMVEDVSQKSMVGPQWLARNPKYQGQLTQEESKKLKQLNKKNSLDTGELKQRGALREKAKQSEYLGILAKTPGFKQEEIEDLGLAEWLAEKKGTVTKAEVGTFVERGGVKVEEVVKGKTYPSLPPDWITQEAEKGWIVLDDDKAIVGRGQTEALAITDATEDFESDEDQTKFANYQEPGGKGYRELLLTLPRAEDEFRSTHYYEPNILAHIRFNERTDADGKKVLFVEEVQSDWHQQGQKKGYGPQKIIEPAKEIGASGLVHWVIRDENGNFLDSAGTLEGAQQLAEFLRSNKISAGVPDAPFKTSWPLLAMKRAIRWGAENGFDKVAWKGDPQQLKSSGGWTDLVQNAEGKWIANGDQNVTSIVNRYMEDLPRGMAKYLKKRGMDARVRKETMPVGEVWSINLSPEMKMQVLDEGQAMYSVAQEGTPEFTNDSDIMASTGMSASAPLYSIPQDDATRFVDPFGEERTDLLTSQRSGMWDRFLYRAQDKMRYLYKKQKELGPVPEDQDAYMAEALYYGKTKNRLEGMHKDLRDPILKAAGKAKVKGAELGRWLVARHAEEANGRLRRINAKRFLNEIIKSGEVSADVARSLKKQMAEIRKGEKGPFAVSSAYQALLDSRLGEFSEFWQKSWTEFSERPSGMTDAEAQQVLEEQGGNEALQDLGQLFDQMNREAIDARAESGLISQLEAGALRNAYQHWSPLMRAGFNDEFRFGGKGQSLGGKEYKVRAGSLRDIDFENVLTQAVFQSEKAIVRSERQPIFKALYELAKANPDDGFWTLDKEDKKPTLGADGSIRMYPVRGEEANELRFKLDGEIHSIHFNPTNENAYRIAHGLKNLDTSAGPLVNTLSQINRWLSFVNTSASPEFMVSNLLRDIQTAQFNMSDTEAKEFRGGILKDLGPSILGIRDSLRGKGKSEWAETYRDFAEQGGTTGWVENYKSISDMTTKMEKQAKRLKTGTPQYVVHNIVQTISDYNTAVENGIRLATYKNLVASGKVSKKRAAFIAKELTVNFNRKGVDGQAINALYLFANAGIQGSMRILRAARYSSSVRKMMGATIAASIGMGLANRELGGEDEDGESFYDKAVEDWEKERNMIFMGENGKYAKIPLPWGYNVLWVLGDQIAAAISAASEDNPEYKAMDSASTVLLSFLGAFSPIQGGTMIQALAPTFADPAVMLAENKTFTGAPLKPEANVWEKVPAPEHQQYWKSARPTSVAVAKFLSDISGGDTVEGGVVDVSPEHLDLIWDSVFGSAGRFLADTGDAGKKLIAGDELEARKTPWLRRIYGEKGSSVDRQLYRERTAEIWMAEKKWKEGVGNRKELRKVLKLLGPAKMAEKRLRVLRKRKKQVGTEERKERIKEQIEFVMTRFNVRYRRTLLSQ